MTIFHVNGAYLRVTTDSRQGGRKYMEDVIKIHNETDPEEDHSKFVYFAVFDGHGGEEAAKFAKQHLLNEITKQKGFWTDNTENISRAIKEGFISCHKLMWKAVGTWPKTLSGQPSTSGTTASIVFIKNKKIFVAHVGDSSIVIGHGCKKEYTKSQYEADCVTVDHKPESPAELKRINAAGGAVMAKAGVQRVVWHRPKLTHQGPVRRSTHFDCIPFLAVARALGDLWSYNSETDSFVVSPEPDIAIYDLEIEKQRCIVVASDGLWNVVKPDEAVRIVQRVEERNENNPMNQNHSNPANLLVRLALNKWADRNMRADNTTAIVIMIHPPHVIPSLSRQPSEASTVRLPFEDSDTDYVNEMEMELGADVEIGYDDANIDDIPEELLFETHDIHILPPGHYLNPGPTSKRIRVPKPGYRRRSSNHHSSCHSWNHHHHHMSKSAPHRLHHSSTKCRKHSLNKRVAGTHGIHPAWGSCSKFNGHRAIVNGDPCASPILKPPNSLSSKRRHSCEVRPGNSCFTSIKRGRSLSMSEGLEEKPSSSNHSGEFVTGNLVKIKPLTATPTGARSRSGVAALGSPSLEELPSSQMESLKSSEHGNTMYKMPTGPVGKMENDETSNARSGSKAGNTSPKTGIMPKSPLKVDTTYLDGTPAMAHVSPLWPSCLGADIELETSEPDILDCVPGPESSLLGEPSQAAHGNHSLDCEPSIKPLAQSQGSIAQRGSSKTHNGSSKVRKLLKVITSNDSNKPVRACALKKEQQNKITPLTRNHRVRVKRIHVKTTRLNGKNNVLRRTRLQVRRHYTRKF